MVQFVILFLIYLFFVPPATRWLARKTVDRRAHFIVVGVILGGYVLLTALIYQASSGTLFSDICGLWLFLLLSVLFIHMAYLYYSRGKRLLDRGPRLKAQSEIGADDGEPLPVRIGEALDSSILDSLPAAMEGWLDFRGLMSYARRLPVLYGEEAGSVAWQDLESPKAFGLMLGWSLLLLCFPLLMADIFLLILSFPFNLVTVFSLQLVPVPIAILMWFLSLCTSNFRTSRHAHVLQDKLWSQWIRGIERGFVKANDKLSWLETSIDAQIAQFQMQRKRHRAFSLSIKLISLFSTVAVAITLGLGMHSRWQEPFVSDIAFVASIVAIVASAFDAFSDGRSLWVTETLTLARLSDLKRDLGFYRSDKDAAELDDKVLGAFKIRLDAILQQDISEWLRLGEGTTRGKASTSGKGGSPFESRNG